MSKLIATLLVAAMTFSLPVSSQAATAKKKVRKKPAASQDYSYAGSATARQRANSRAYERGEYYEEMSDAHVFGSRSWWYLKEREMGSSRN